MFFEKDFLNLLNLLASCSSVSPENLAKYTELVDGDVYVPFIPKHAYNRTDPSGEKNRRIYLYEFGSQLDLLRNVSTTYMWSSPLPPATKGSRLLLSL